MICVVGFEEPYRLALSIKEDSILDPTQVMPIPAMAVQSIINVRDGLSIPEADGSFAIISEVGNRTSLGVEQSPFHGDDSPVADRTEE